MRAPLVMHHFEWICRWCCFNICWLKTLLLAQIRLLCTIMYVYIHENIGNSCRLPLAIHIPEKSCQVFLLYLFTFCSEIKSHKCEFGINSWFDTHIPQIGKPNQKLICLKNPRFPSTEFLKQFFFSYSICWILWFVYLINLLNI